MPYLDDISDKDKQADQSQGGGQQISAGAQVFGATAPATNADTANATAQKGSGQFANLNEYLRVNQPQSFGDQLAGKVGQDVQSAGDTVQNAGDEFKTRVDKATTKENPDLVQQATGANAANFVADPNSVKAFQDQLNANYGGPTSFADAGDLYGSANSAAQTASGKAKAASTEEGRFALLDNYYGRENYSGGQKSLDNLLVQSDPNAQQSFSTIQQNADAVAKKQADQQISLSGYGAAARQTTQDAKAHAQSALGLDASGNVISDSNGNPTAGAIGGLHGQIANEVAAAKAAYEKQLDGFTKMGVTQPDYGVNRLNYLNPETGITRDVVATPQEAARSRALAQLAGQNGDPWLTPAPPPAVDSRGRVINNPLSPINQYAFGQAVNSAKGNYQNAHANLDRQFQAIIAQGRAPGRTVTDDEIFAQSQAVVKQMNALEREYGQELTRYTNTKA